MRRGGPWVWMWMWALGWFEWVWWVSIVHQYNCSTEDLRVCCTLTVRCLFDMFVEQLLVQSYTVLLSELPSKPNV